MDKILVAVKGFVGRIVLGQQLGMSDDDLLPFLFSFLSRVTPMLKEQEDIKEGQLISTDLVMQWIIEDNMTAENQMPYEMRRFFAYIFRTSLDSVSPELEAKIKQFEAGTEKEDDLSLFSDFLDGEMDDE